MSPEPGHLVAEDAAVDRVGEMLSRRVGLRLDPAIRSRMARAVLEGAQAQGLDAGVYGSRLDGDPTLLQDLIDRVTVQESGFFRDPAQFEALRQYVLPTLSEPAFGRPVRIWSAGCANGQEAYSLAMVLADSGCPDWEVMATDISRGALERTRRARYSIREIAGLTPEQRARHLVPARDEWEISAPLRDRVRVAHHNLVADPPPFAPGACDVVFCRNVLIYIRYDDVVAFVERVDDWLGPAGWLFLGYSETLWQLTDRFRLHQVGEAFAYRRRMSEPAAPAVAATRGPIPERRPAGAQLGRRHGPQGGAIGGRRRLPRPVRPRANGVTEVLAAGEAATNSGDYAAAVRAFRAYTFLDPDQPVAHLRLGLALEEIGDTGAARRAYSAARAALGRSETAAVEANLEGYRVNDLARLLDAKLASPARPLGQ